VSQTARASGYTSHTTNVGYSLRGALGIQFSFVFCSNKMQRSEFYTFMV
jgi:hypothetical protein